MTTVKSSFTVAALLVACLYSYNATAEESGAADTTAAPTDAPAAAAPAAAPTTTPPAADDHIARAVFTSGVQGREPVDTITTLSNDKDRIYFFSDLRGLAGQTVIHRWEYQGKTMSEVKFNVGGPRWRVWSSKTLLPHWTGEWRVEIIDGDGKSVGEASFTYTAATAPK